MRSTASIKALGTTLLLASVLLVTAAPAPARKGSITGKLNKAGYTVIALADGGKARAVRAKGKKFKVVPPAAKVTLHLRGPDGVYAGPIVVGAKGSSKALVGVKAGASLGPVKVLKGYAKPRRKLARRFVDRRRTARARKGVPVGAGRFGRVRSSARGSAGPGRDQDSDGLPGAFDVDDDGDLVLDNFERTGARSASVRTSASPPPAPGSPPPPPAPGSPPPLGTPAPGAPAPPGGGGSASQFRVFSNLKLSIEQSLNANASAVTDAQIDQAMSSATTLAIEVASGDAVELDCGGLTYCSSSGTGVALEGNRPFPDAFDSDGDGFGTLTAGPTGDFQLRTGAKASEIGSGDAFVERVTTGGSETQLPGLLNYAFSTTPALTRWSEGAGSGTISYPVAPGSTGTAGSPIVVSGSGDVIVTMTFWRPQRKAIAGSGEGSEWVDIGRLKYTADLPNGPRDPAGGDSGKGPGNCPASTYSTSDPNLAIAGDGLVDSASDRPSDPANTLTFSVNLTQCLASAGKAWSSGQTLNMDIQARSEFGDNAAQILNFRRA